MMPYGIAKDRDGDSREWIAMQLGHECGLEETAQDYATEQELDEMLPAIPAIVAGAGALARAAVPAIVRTAPAIMRSAEKLVGSGATAAAGAAKSLPKGTSTSSTAKDAAKIGGGGAAGAAGEKAVDVLTKSEPASDTALDRYITRPLTLERSSDTTAQDQSVDDVKLDHYVTKPLALEGSSCNMTTEGEYCPEHGLDECGMYEGDYGLTLTPTAESREFDLARLKQLAFGK
jgi:hypothetical protein